MDLIVFFNTLFGFFTFVAWAICLLILFFIFTEKRFSKVINDQFYNFATLVAIVCSVGSLVYSEVVGFIPCKFCWYQRYLMYPIALILIIGLFNKKFIRAGIFKPCWRWSRRLSHLPSKWWRRRRILRYRCAL